MRARAANGYRQLPETPQSFALTAGRMTTEMAWFSLQRVPERVTSALKYSHPESADLSEQVGVLKALLRDIVGNPFRPVAFDPGWRTSTVVALAEQMYGSRDFAPMPILADALQDTGCENEDILAHCCDPAAPHVRGCWVVDLVLGKS